MQDILIVCLQRAVVQFEVEGSRSGGKVDMRDEAYRMIPLWYQQPQMWWKQDEVSSHMSEEESTQTHHQPPAGGAEEPGDLQNIWRFNKKLHFAGLISSLLVREYVLPVICPSHLRDSSNDPLISFLALPYLLYLCHPS